MAKRAENERAEAYRIYVSDSLALYNTFLTKGEIDIPRYVDFLKHEEEKPQESYEQHMSRFDALRRKQE